MPDLQRMKLEKGLAAVEVRRRALHDGRGRHAERKQNKQRNGQTY